MQYLRELPKVERLDHEFEYDYNTSRLDMASMIAYVEERGYGAEVDLQMATLMSIMLYTGLGPESFLSSSAQAEQYFLWRVCLPSTIIFADCRTCHSCATTKTATRLRFGCGAFQGLSPADPSCEASLRVS